MAVNDFTSRAVLLYGPRKSGSSLLHNLLDGGQSLLMLPGELKLKPLVQKERDPRTLAEYYVRQGRLGFQELHKGNVAEPQSLLPREDYHIDSLTREQTWDLLDVPLYVERLRNLLLDPPSDYASIVRRDVAGFCEALKISYHEYSCWAAKEVGGNTEEMIPFFRSVFPASKIIFIARDPHFVVRSIILDRRRKGISLDFGGVWEECKRVQTVLNFIHNNATDKDVVVIYEKLTQDVEGEMRRLASALEIPFEPILCQPTTLGVPVVVRTSSQKTTTVFRPELDWQKDLTTAQATAIRLFHTLKPLRYGSNKKKYVSYQELVARYEERENARAALPASK